MIGGIIGWLTAFSNNISGPDGTLIVIGFALTGALLVAAVPMIIALTASILFGGDGDVDLGFDIEVANHDDIHIDPVRVDELPSGKRSPWRRHRRDEST